MVIASDNRQRPELLMERGRQELTEGEVEAATRSFAQAVTAAQELGMAATELEAVNLQARAINALGQPQRALSLLLRSLRSANSQAPADRIAVIRSNAGELQRILTDYPAALENLVAAQAHFDANEHLQRAGAINLINTGLLYQDMGRQPEARKFLLRAQQAGRDMGDRMIVTVALNNLANSDMSVGDYVVAAERFRSALAEARELLQLEYQIDNLDGLGRALAVLGNHEQARQAHSEAYELTRSIGDRRGEMELLLNLGLDNQQLGRHAEAVTSFTDALELAEQLEQRRVRLDLHGHLSRAHEAAGDPWAALEHARTHAVLSTEVFSEESQERLQELEVRYRVEQSQRELENYRRTTDLMRQAVAEAQSQVRITSNELYEAQVDIIERLALAAEFHDDETGAHNRRVARNAVAIAFVLGFEDVDLEMLFAAAKLHDVGKVAVSDTILHKPGKLSDDERELIRQHTIHGARILTGGSSRMLQVAESICLSHHEKYDGTGYPEGLKGEAIPVFARIVAVADVLDALVHSRPYKPAWPVSEALAEISSESGSRFDPKAVQACQLIFSEATGLSPLDNVTGWHDVQELLTGISELRPR